MDFAALIYHRQAFLDGQWWLPLSAQIAHFSSFHALANVAGALLLWNLFRAWIPWQQQALMVVGGAIGVALVVVWDVHCNYYAGASGALHGWAAGGALYLAWKSPGRQRTIGSLLLAGITFKLWIAPEQLIKDFLLDFPVYRPSHVAGAVGGVLAALGCVWCGLLGAHRRDGR